MPRLRCLPMDSRYVAAIAPGGASQVRLRALSLSLACLAATGGVGGWTAAVQAQGVGQGQVVGTNQRLNLRVRRQSDGVEVVIEGVGAAPELQQTTRGAVWLGRLLTSRPALLPAGGQRLAVPEAGFQSLSLVGAGQLFELQITPIPGYPLGRPVVSADGRDLILSFAASGQPSQQTSSLDLRRPGRVSEPSAAYVPPLQPRAVAPPVGDMAVGTMLITNSSYLNVSGPPVTMTLRNAPARDVLMALSRLGGYGFVFVEDSKKADNAAPNVFASQLPISISFRNENYGQALNSALLAAGLQAKRQGNTILAGANVLGKSFGAQLSKVYRLNQISSNSAADYLANLGAQVKKTNEVRTAVSTGISQADAVATSNTSSTTQYSTTTDVRSYGADTGPLLGLLVTTDPRLSTITLVGEARVVSVAESYLRQLDLRQRQVALSVKILDVSLDNVKTLDNSFAFRYGNNFIVNNAGQLQGAFGGLLPPRGDAFSNENTRQTFSSNSNSSGGTSTFGNSNFSNNGTAGSNSLNNSSSSNSGSSGTTFKIDNTDTLSFQDASNVSSYLKQQDLNVTSTFPSTASGTLLSVDKGLSTDQSTKISSALSSILGRSVTASTQSNFSNSNNSSNNSSNTTNNSNSGNSSNNNSNSFNNSNSYNGSNNRNPGLLYPRNNFYSFVQAMIESRSSKVLASPTLILSENSEELRKGEDSQALNISNLSTGSSGSSGSGGSGGTNSDSIASIGRTKANESYVTVGEQVITNYTVTTGTQGNGNSCQPSFGIAGLTFGARISKIDDNGFVTFSMSPAITAALRQQVIPGCGPIDILAVRRLDTGSARVRDGQTLVMTGVISDADREEVSKWPILGDLPIIGQFFRNSSNNRGKRELVILVTPHIINDTDGGNFGYGYQAGTTEGRRLVADPNGLIGPR